MDICLLCKFTTNYHLVNVNHLLIGGRLCPNLLIDAYQNISTKTLSIQCADLNFL